MALDGESLQLEKVKNRPDGRLPVLLAAAAAVLVALALVKPWPAPTAVLSPSNDPRRTAPTATPSAAGSVVGGEVARSIYFRQCFPTANWRLTAVQDDGSMMVRTVWPAAPSFTAKVPAATRSGRLHGSDVQG